ncbi:MAG: penicillin-binding protein [Bacilli bacterium]|nr:penicillin-binding protein [Bacilli bacterium]
MRRFKKILKLFLIPIFIFLLGNIVLYVIAFITPKLEIKTANSFSFYDNNNELFFSGNSNSEWVSLDEISPNLINATISVEDKNFYKHKGFDFLRIAKAMYLNVVNRDIVQGASTITQQYARNLYLTFDKTWKRKIDEAWLTIELESHYSKDKILEGYLNTINYGQGVYGIQNAARFYFDKDAKDLTISEASMLAGIPNSPANYSPLVDEYSAKKRQNTVLNMMYSNEYINKDEMDKAYNDNLVYIGKKEKYNLSTLMYYQDAVMNELKEIKSIPSSFLSTGGLKIYTALDLEAQTYFEESMTEQMQNVPDAQTSGVMMNPNNGEIIALIGGTNYVKSQYNRATDSKRQVGSTMKPFLYYAALENGFTSSTNFLSAPTTFTFGTDQTYSPKNFSEKYANMEISLAAAIAYSDNIYAVKTHMFLGEEALVETASRVGIDAKLEAVPSLPLGTNEINMIDFIGGYGAFANLGYKVDPHLIRKVEDIDGNILYESKKTKERVLNKSTVFILNELLSNTYSYDFVDYSTPTLMSIAPKLTNKYAIKSGSTDTDYLTIGYNKDIVLGVWYGYDNNQTINSSESKITKQIWANTMEKYFKEKETSWYDVPDNVVGVLINPITGELSTDNDEKKHICYYIKGTEPYSDTPDTILKDVIGN